MGTTNKEKLRPDVFYPFRLGGGLILLVALVLVGCRPATEPIDIPGDEETKELPASAQRYIEMSRAALAQQLDVEADVIRLESISEPAAGDEGYVVRFKVDDQIYELHSQADEVVPLSESPPAVRYSTADLGQSLEEAGATIALGRRIDPAVGIFSVPGQLVHVGHEEIQVYVYESVQAAAADAERVSPSGSEVAAAREGGSVSIVDWVDRPYFYQFGNLLVLYVGEDGEIIALLERVMGAPFASAQRVENG